MNERFSPEPIGTLTLMRVLWRSFFFQAANNYERMQNVGFAYCIMPALKRLYQGDALQAAAERHLRFFNSHPYMTASLLGAAIRLEEDAAHGRVDPDRVVGFKASMMGPMAAIGDSFFWSSLRPLAAGLAIFGVLAGLLWSPVIFLVLFNLFHIGIRVFGVFGGYRQGEDICQSIHRLSLVRFADKSHYLAGILLGATAALFADHAIVSPTGLGNGMEPFLVFALTAIFILALNRDFKIPTLLYGFTLGCIALVASFNALLPLG